MYLSEQSVKECNPSLLLTFDSHITIKNSCNKAYRPPFYFRRGTRVHLYPLLPVERYDQFPGVKSTHNSTVLFMTQASYGLT